MSCSGDTEWPFPTDLFDWCSTVVGTVSSEETGVTILGVGMDSINWAIEAGCWTLWSLSDLWSGCTASVGAVGGRADDATATVVVSLTCDLCECLTD